jgi:predicted transposase YbfD/YdcC
MEINETDIIRLKASLEGISDPRREWGNLRHKLEDMLVIALSAIILGGTDYESMEDWGNEREAWFRTFLELPNGIPDKDTFRRLFERLRPEQLLEALHHWLGQPAESGNREINIDGKTIRGSGKAGEHGAMHVVSAWVGEHNLVPGQVVTDEKSNEITAIPQLLDLIEIRGDVVTIDAMGCQTGIAEKIRKNGGDYILAVKENQLNLYQDIRDYFRWLEEDKVQREPVAEWHSELEVDHGRIERRAIRAVTNLTWLEGKANWKGLSAIIQYRCIRGDGKETVSTDRYYISSLKADAETFGDLIRKHWSIENHLHWSLDVLFREDACRARKDKAPLNLNILRKVALARLKAVAAPDKRFSTRRRMVKAAANPDFLFSILFGK